jgi:predicted DNA-binding transcriptional regulator AlpA
LSAPTVTVRGVPLIRFRDLPELLEVSEPTAARYIKRPDFPKPQTIAGMRFWDKAAVKKWGKTSRPPLGRPPRSD